MENVAEGRAVLFYFHSYKPASCRVSVSLQPKEIPRYNLKLALYVEGRERQRKEALLGTTDKNLVFLQSFFLYQN